MKILLTYQKLQSKDIQILKQLQSNIFFYNLKALRIFTQILNTVRLTRKVENGLSNHFSKLQK